MPIQPLRKSCSIGSIPSLLLPVLIYTLRVVKKGSLHRGKVAVVSGGTSGIGKEIVKGLLEAGYFVHIPARNLSKATNLLATELKPFSKQVAIHTCDLSSIKSIDNFITEFCNSNSSIDLLVNSAGNYLPSFQKTEDGIESHMAVHVMGTFLLTEGLKDLLRSKPNSHVINVVSSSHNILAKFSLDAFTKKTEFSRVGGYCNAKFAQVLLTKQMALQWQSPSSGPTSIRVNAVHPGMAKSDISRDDILSRTLIQKILNYIFPISILSARRGALTVLWMALSEEEGMGRVTGRYFHDFAEEPASDVLEEAFRRGDGVALLERCRELKSKGN